MQSTAELTEVCKDPDSDTLQPCGGAVGNAVYNARIYIRKCLLDFDSKRLRQAKKGILIIVPVIYSLYVFSRWLHSDCQSNGWRDGYGFMFILICLTLCYLMYTLLIPQATRILAKYSNNNTRKNAAITIKRCYHVFLVATVILFLSLSTKDAINEPRRFLSLAGYCSILLLAFIFSKHPNYVRWDIIARGVALHFLMALVFVKWQGGRTFLSVISDIIIKFFEFAYVGARFVYGNMLIDLGVFIFKSLSVLFFLAMVINVLFYWGILQTMFRSLGHAMQILLGTTIVESSNAVASVFLGMAEAPLLFEPYLTELTASEMHAVMTSGFATVAGTVLAAYVSLGANPATLVAASAMAAPASLTVAKLLHPEKHRTKTSVKSLVLYKSEDVNAVDAACKGAMLGCRLVSAIAANVLSFVSLVAFFNALLSWLGQLAGIPDLTFERVVGIVFVPLAWVMGVSPSQVTNVARLIGIKTVINEFVGYQQLGLLKIGNQLSARSEAIATYAMCGFANPGSVAIVVSSLVTVCPDKRELITGVALRAFISGSFSSFLSASLAGFITPEEGFQNEETFRYDSTNATLTNDTSCYFYPW